MVLPAVSFASFVRFAVLGAGAVVAVAACASSAADSASSGSAISITSSDDACDLSTTDWPAGPVTLEVTNSGSDVTEVYVFEGKRVMAERENITPGSTDEVAVDLDPGSYSVVCKPGMTGDGLRVDVTVTDAKAQAAPRAADA